MIADRGLKQLHVAETEKYPHVTYFFNGGEEHEHEGETFELVPSPRDVPTYDHKPEMSAYEATDAFVERYEADTPAFAIINFANADMVGHTGVIEAAVKAVEAVDECLGRVLETVHAAGGACISRKVTVTAIGSTFSSTLIFTPCRWRPACPGARPIRSTSRRRACGWSGRASPAPA